MGRGNEWCILKVASARTLKLAETLRAAGIDAWSPQRTIKRDAPGNRRRVALKQPKVMIEIDLPIIPGFVFARADRLDDIIRAGALPYGPHPAFSLLQVGDRVPLVGEKQIAGLRAAEAEAGAAIAGERDAERWQQERRARAVRLGTERARRKALRQEIRALSAGEQVTVDDMPALAGVVGTVIKGWGTAALIHFGGSLTMEVEAWRVRPSNVQSGNTLHRDAA
jgi:hypothetical protein